MGVKLANFRFFFFFFFFCGSYLHSLRNPQQSSQTTGEYIALFISITATIVRANGTIVLLTFVITDEIGHFPGNCAPYSPTHTQSYETSV
jgi:hypothetical protein